MCGRVRLSSDVSEIKLVFSIPPHRPTPNFPPSWNAAPTDLLPVRYDRRASERSLDFLRWGLIPHWAEDIKVGFANINAKAEGIENRPAFREAFQRRRCLCRSITFTSGRRPREVMDLGGPFSSHLIGPDGVAALPVAGAGAFGKAVRSRTFQMPPSRTSTPVQWPSTSMGPFCP
jgi:hypothetical protein